MTACRSKTIELCLQNNFFSGSNKTRISICTCVDCEEQRDHSVQQRVNIPTSRDVRAKASANDSVGNVLNVYITNGNCDLPVKQNSAKQNPKEQLARGDNDITLKKDERTGW